MPSEGGEVKDGAVASVPSGSNCFSLSLTDFILSDIIVFQDPE